MPYDLESLNDPETVIFGRTMRELNELMNDPNKLADVLLKKLFPHDSYKNLQIEPQAYREPRQTKKELLTYDKSFERIKTINPSARHLRPSEAFGLIIDCLEGKLNQEHKEIYDDMLTSYGEWLSMAIERQGDKFICYLDPEGLVWNGNTYVKQNFTSSDRKEFAITGKKSQQWIDLKEFDQEFIKFIYGRTFKDLPKEMQEGNRRAQVYLSPEGTIWPVARGVFVGFAVYAFLYYDWASRGVRSKV